MSDAIRDVLVQALFGCLVSLELADDEAIDLDFAVSISEDVAAILDQLETSDRELLATLVRQHAASETNPARRKLLEDSPGALGLVEGVDE